MTFFLGIKLLEIFSFLSPKHFLIIYSFLHFQKIEICLLLEGPSFLLYLKSIYQRFKNFSYPKICLVIFKENDVITGFSFICKKWLYSFPNLFIFSSIFNSKGMKMILEYLRKSYISACA